MTLQAPQSESEARFVNTLRHLLREARPMSNREMAEMFEDDGYLRTEMREILLHEGPAALPSG